MRLLFHAPRPALQLSIAFLLATLACASMPGEQPVQRLEAADASTASDERTASTERSGSDVLMDELRRLRSHLRRSSDAWPGFRLDRQVLIAALRPDGPTYLMGDSMPPGDYAPLEAMEGVFVRRGAPPDSLLGLRLAMRWNGGSAAGTAVPVDTATARYGAHFLLHEAFHTHQLRLNEADPSRFLPESAPRQALPSREALAALNLEGRYLALALLERDRTTAVEHARHAVAVRRSRCALVGGEQCASERGVEQNEGSATYVASVLLEEVLGYGADGRWPDSLARAVSPVTDLRRLERWHHYDTGHLWIRLVERFAPEMPYDRLELSPPDVVLGELLGIDDSTAARLARESARTPLAAAADSAAGHLLAAEEGRRLAAEAAFDERPGIPVRVYFGRVTSLSRIAGTLPNGEPELTLRFGGNVVVFRGPSRPSCCPPGAWTIAQVAGRSVRVDGSAVPLDRPGTFAGRVELELDAVRVAMPDAAVRVYADSVVVTAGDP